MKKAAGVTTAVHFRDKVEIENFFYQISNFEKGTRNKKGYLVVERELSLLNLTRFFEIEKSRHALPHPPIFGKDFPKDLP